MQKIQTNQGKYIGKCQRDGCTNKVYSPNRKYCSDNCSRTANRKKSFERNKQRAQDYKKMRLNPASRTCLKCRQVFSSEGPWNRICLNCARKNNSYSKNSAGKHISLNPSLKGGKLIPYEFDDKSIEALTRDF